MNTVRRSKRVHFSKIGARKGSMTTTASQLADEALDAFLDAYPVAATLLGLRSRDDRLTDYSEAGDAATRARISDIANRAREVDAVGPDHDGWVTRAVVRQQAEAFVDRLDARAVEYTVTDNFIAPVADLLFSLPMIGISEPAQADGYLARLAALPDALATIADRHRAGIAAGRLPVRRLAEAAVAHLDRYLASGTG
jgi:uncharacterized protein (DUF885 family)